MGLHPIQTLKNLTALAQQLGTDPASLWNAIMEEVKSKMDNPRDQGALAFELVTRLCLKTVFSELA